MITRSYWHGLTTLFSASGFVVDAVESGHHALELLHAEHYDVILLDYQMREMTGLQFLHIVQSHQTWQAIPVIILSASMIHGEECLLAGANRFLPKPCQFATLIQTVQELASGVDADQVPAEAHP